MKYVLAISVPMLACILLSGCGEPSSTTAKNEPPPAAAAPAGPDLSAAMNNVGSAPTTTEEPPPTTTTEPEMVSEVATVGSGRKGQGYGGGMYTEPARAYFRTQERIAFDIQIPDAIKTFKALDPDGKGPKTHEEFMERIIKENSIALPDLPEGHRFRYDPETEELLIDRPR